MPPGPPEFDLVVIGAGINGAGHRARCRRPRPQGAGRRAGRHRGGHVAVEHEADPRRPALPRAVRVPAGPRIARRARGGAAAGAAHRRAAVVRAAARAASASRVDAARRPLPLRPPRPARDAAGLLRRRSRAHAVGRRAEAQVRQGLRLFRRPRRRRAPRRLQRDGRASSRRRDPRAHGVRVRAARAAMPRGRSGARRCAMPRARRAK